MSDLNQIICQNAVLALERYKKEAADNGRKVYAATVARGMARILVPEPQDPVRTLRALLRGERPWRSDYLEAFAACTATPVERLVSANYEGDKIPDASYGFFLTQFLGRRLTPRQVRKIAHNMSRELERPGMFDLVTDITDVLLDARTRAAAGEAVGELIRHSHLWERPAAEMRKKRKISPRKA